MKYGRYAASFVSTTSELLKAPVMLLWKIHFITIYRILFIHTTDNDPPLTSLLSDYINSFSLYSVTTDEIVSVISKLANKWIADDDLVPSFLVRDCRFVLAEPLTNKSCFEKSNVSRSLESSSSYFCS